MSTRAAPPITTVSALQARRVLLNLQGLAANPRKSGPRAVAALVDRLGYVQIDSINVVDRAHHLILATRLEGFRPAHLSAPIEKSRVLFEHWTHDACAIPSRWFAHWRHRFDRYANKPTRSEWWHERFGNDPEPILRRTLERIAREGPLKARDFARPEDHRSTGWWEWHPEKAALEHLWRSGLLAIARRERFEKVYDLTERVFPAAAGISPSDLDDHDAWACREAIARVGIATAREIADFFRAIPIERVRTWCVAAVERGELMRVNVTPAEGGAPVPSLALPDWKRFAKPLNEERMIALCPFDPCVRERGRLQRLFAFDYRFEAFVPAAQRRFGYYVFPLLEGDRMIGRIDPKFDRATATLTVRGPWWEPGVRADAARRRRLAAAVDKVAADIGAGTVSFLRH